MKVVSELLAAKYGKPYAEACRKETVDTVSDKLKHKMSVQSPPKILVEKYLIEISKNYDLDYEPDPQVMKEEQAEKSIHENVFFLLFIPILFLFAFFSDSDGLLIDLGANNIPRPPGFIDFPAPPGLPMPSHPPPFSYPVNNTYKKFYVMIFFYVFLLI